MPFINMYVDESEVARARESRSYIFVSKRVMLVAGALVAAIIVGCILITHFATLETSRRQQLAQCESPSGNKQTATGRPGTGQLEKECALLMCQNPLSANGERKHKKEAQVCVYHNNLADSYSYPNL